MAALSDDRPTAVYRFFDASDQLLYVGVAYEPEQRWLSHYRRDWWLLVVRHTLEWHTTRDLATAAEREAIRRERPLHNRAHSTLPAKPDEVSMRDLRTGLADVLNAVTVRGVITYVTQHRRRLAAVVPVPVAEQEEERRRGESS